MLIDFQTDPSRYRHWKIDTEGDVATLWLDVDENGGLFDGYKLKLNSYDLGVDIELNDAIQRLRFEHPEVKGLSFGGTIAAPVFGKVANRVLPHLGIFPGGSQLIRTASLSTKPSSVQALVQ